MWSWSLRIVTLTCTCVLGALGLSGSGVISSTAVPEPTVHADDPPPGADITRKPGVVELASAAGVAHMLGGDNESTSGGDYVPPGSSGVTGMDHHVAPSCSGTGADGNRVQVIYAVEQGDNDRYDSLVPSIRSWVGDVDDTFAASARQYGADFRVRWVHDECVPVIIHEVLPSGSLHDGFDVMVDELKSRGYDAKSRKYLVFADATDMCGWAHVYRDSSPDNANDGRYPMFARVDSSCWSFRKGWHSVAAHELMHTIGGVHHDAPHANPPGYHCVDESDAMCYDDGSGRAIQERCDDASEALFDCGGDDYFRPGPPDGSYLATHWNTADSSFLDDISRYPTRVATTVSPKTVSWGMATTIAGTVVRDQDGEAVPGQPVKLYWREAGQATWNYRESATTDSAGEYAFTVEPPSHGRYLVRLAPDSAKYAGSSGLGEAVAVRYSVTGGFMVPVMPRGFAATLSGSVGPDRPGELVQLQRHDGQAWQTVASTTLSSRSTYSFDVKHDQPGRYQYRVFKAAGDLHAAGWTSKHTLTVF